MTSWRGIPPVVLLAAVFSIAGAAPASVADGQLGRIDHVADGDTVDLTSGAKIRLVQIDTPEVYFSPECYGKQASGGRCPGAVGSEPRRLDRPPSLTGRMAEPKCSSMRPR